MEQKREVWIGRGHIDVIKVLTWSPDGKYLASCDDDATIRLWNAEDGTLFKVLKEGQEIIYDLAWSPDGTQLASTCGADIRIWDVASGTHVDISLDPMHILRAVAWSSQGDKLLAGGRGGAIYWFETDRWSRLAVHQEHQGTVMSIRISSDGRTAASTDSDGAIIIWNIAQATPLHVLHLERPYERLNISGIQGITEAQKTTLLALGAVGDL